MISFLLYAAIIFGSILALLCLIAGAAGFFSGIIHSIRHDLCYPPRFARGLFYCFCSSITCSQSRNSRSDCRSQ